MGLRFLDGGFDPGFDSLRLRSVKAAQPTPQPTVCSLSGVEGNEYLINRLLDPTPRTQAGIALAETGLVSAMIDISDGILADFGHIAELSGVGGILALMDLPLSEHFRAAVRTLAAVPFQLALSGGEDYELCFTAAPVNREKIAVLLKKCGVAGVPVGIVGSLPEVRVLDADGVEYHIENQGFNHF
jgi:thiamine-monophosphate kinase